MPVGAKTATNILANTQRERVQLPSRLAEEAVIAAVMSLVDATAGQNQIGDEPPPMGQHPARHQAHENRKGGFGENASEFG